MSWGAMSKAKAVTATIRLVIPAGQAKPSPPVGPALGQAGLKIMDFCKDFNAKTADYKVRACMACSVCDSGMPAFRRCKHVAGHLSGGWHCSPHPSILKAVADSDAPALMWHAYTPIGALGPWRPARHLPASLPALCLQSDVPVPVEITAFADKTFK